MYTEGWCPECNEIVALDSNGYCSVCGECCCDGDRNDMQPACDAVVLWPYGHQLFAGSQAKSKRRVDEPLT